MAIEVRRVRPTDTQVLKAVRLAALEDSPSAFSATYADEALRTDEQWAERATAGSDGPDRATWFALDRGRVVGLVGGYRADPSATVVDLVSMWTSPGARRSGVGRQLVRAVLAWAGESGASAVDLWVVEGNEPARRLYQAMGFEEVGDHQALPSDPCRTEVRMTLRL